MRLPPRHAADRRAGAPCHWAVVSKAELRETPLQLPADEVHVWRAFLEIGEAEFHRTAPALSDDERLRAERFRFPSDRRAFMVSRAILRCILGQYLGEAPAKLSFTYGEQGKPALAGSEFQWLRFNASHSHGLALYAVAREREVGVDVERIQPELASWQAASEFFAPGEIHVLRNAEDELNVPAFFACWTRKEAYLKARGSGLAAPLNSFEVPVDPALDEPAVIANASGVWMLQSLEAGEGHAAACAAQGDNWQLCLWQWSADAE